MRVGGGSLIYIDSRQLETQPLGQILFMLHLGLGSFHKCILQSCDLILGEARLSVVGVGARGLLLKDSLAMAIILNCMVVDRVVGIGRLLVIGDLMRGLEV